MARADTAGASLRSDSIQGLAKSIAKPTYRRLLSAEPLLRRAVPALIIAFLITICVGAVVQVLEQRRQVLLQARQTIEALADELAIELNQAAREARGNSARTSAALERALPAWAMAGARSIIVADSDGAIVASIPSDPQKIGRRMLDLLGPGQPLTTFGAAAGTLEITLPDGAAALATVRTLRNPLGVVAVVETASDALSGWRSATALTVTLSATTGFVVLILGFAFHWQATRAREADLIHDTVRGRIDTALNRGRCGLWDWDLARGRVFWSRSMFDILGLPAKDDLLGFGELNALVHPDDIDLYALARQLADSEVQAIDHAFRMRHADGRWLWLRVRCELTRQEGEAGLHLIGIAVDVSEQKNLVERTTAADLRLRDAIETRGGHIFKTIGDDFCAAFPVAVSALEAAVAAQRPFWAPPERGCIGHRRPLGPSCQYWQTEVSGAERQSWPNAASGRRQGYRGRLCISAVRWRRQACPVVGRVLCPSLRRPIDSRILRPRIEHPG